MASAISCCYDPSVNKTTLETAILFATQAVPLEPGSPLPFCVLARVYASMGNSMGVTNAVETLTNAQSAVRWSKTNYTPEHEHAWLIVDAVRAAKTALPAPHFKVYYDRFCTVFSHLTSRFQTVNSDCAVM